MRTLCPEQNMISQEGLIIPPAKSCMQCTVHWVCSLVPFGQPPVQTNLKFILFFLHYTSLFPVEETASWLEMETVVWGLGHSQIPEKRREPQVTRKACALWQRVLWIWDFGENSTRRCHSIKLEKKEMLGLIDFLGQEKYWMTKPICVKLEVNKMLPNDFCPLLMASISLKPCYGGKHAEQED